jgi:hypothetical protein
MKGKRWIAGLALGMVVGLLLAVCRSRCPGLVLE